MSRRADVTVSDEQGTPEPDVYITVKDVNGDLAALYNDDGTSLSNPFQSGADGSFVYNVAAAGTYTEEYRINLADSPRTIRTVSLTGTSYTNLFINASSLEPIADTVFIQTTGYSSLDVGSALYVKGTRLTPESGFTTADGQDWRLSTEQDITPEMFGSDEAAALAYLKAVAGNLSSNGYYKGSAPLTVQANVYNITTPLDITHNVIIEGAGAARFSPGAGGAPSQLSWAAGSSGIRAQNVNTSGDSTIDGANHFGAGVLTLRSIRLQGGYTSTEGNFHGIVGRTPVTLSDVSVYNFQGEGLQGVAASSGPYSAYGGNFSASYIESCRFESNRSGAKIAGADANVVTIINTEFISNRQAGAFIDSGIGPVLLLGTHAAGNGMDGQSQCSYSGKRYAVKVGQESGASTNAPSGTTADNTWWLYIEAGGAAAWAPAWVSGMTWRPGGDYIVANDTVTALLLGAYSEEGSFSQFGGNTLLVNPQIAERYYRGGVTIRAGAGQFQVLNDTTITGNLTAQGVTTVLGRSSGAVSDNSVYFENTNLFTFLYFRTNGVINGTLQVGNNTSWFDVPTTHYSVINGTPIHLTTSSGLTFQANKGIMGSNAIAPTTGSHTAGEIVFNSTPAPGGKIGWVCTTGGSPGTWKAFGAIDA